MKLLLVLAVLGAAHCYNPEENADPELFEGDMFLTAEQRYAAEHGLDVDQSTSRGAIKQGLWPKGILYYTIDNSLRRSQRAMNAITAAMKMWSDNTCITFKERRNERYYARFTGGGGCSSYVGRSSAGQPITLASGCWYVGTVAHEIGHALGFYHEQSRPDRDQYVTIYKQNIQRGMEFNFNKYSRSKIDSLGTPYDYDSIMHYNPRAFSKNGRPTILPKKSGVSIGNRKKISQIDIQQMNLLYKCGGGGGGGGGGGTPPPPPPGNCEDTGRYCSYHVPRGDCKKIQIVRERCKKSCGLC